MARGFGAAESNSLTKAGGNAFKSINADKDSLYEYLESDHSRVMEWSAGDVSRIAKAASVIREAYPEKKSLAKMFDNEAVDEAVKASSMFNPDENGQLDEHIEFAKGFNALDKAIETGDAKKIGSSARELLNTLEKQNGKEYIDEVDGGNVEDPYVSEMLKGLRGLVNVSQGTIGSKDKAQAEEMRDSVISNFMERGSESSADFNDMFNSPSGNRFPSPFEMLRNFTAKGIDVKKTFTI